MAVTVVRRQPRLAGSVVAVSVAAADLAGVASGVASLLLRDGVEVSRIAKRAVLPSTTPFREQILAVEEAGAVLPSRSHPLLELQAK
jgi:hypothetical protein